jgi:hypothetical protein
MVEEIERLPWIMIAGACLAGVVVWAIMLGAMWIRHHHRQTLRYRILEALAYEDGLLLFEIGLAVRRNEDDPSDVRAELDSLMAEGLVYRIPSMPGYSPEAIRHRYYLTRDGADV